MISQPDKLFRDKLEDFQQPAPLGAWDKIESNLAKRNYKIVWLRVAAGVALLSAAAIALWPTEKEKQTLTETHENSVTPIDSVKKPILNQQEEKEEIRDKVLTPPQKKYTSPIAKSDKSDQKSIQPVQDSVAIIPLYESKELIAAVGASEEKVSSKTIIYTADEVNSKFLKKKLPPEATPDTKEASGIQKLIGLAYAAKNSEATLGDLRQKKDDILALNFGKKKGEN